MNDSERRELANDASELLANKAFMTALAQLEKDAVENLLGPDPNPAESIAAIKLARALPQQLKIYIDRQKRHG